MPKLTLIFASLAAIAGATMFGAPQPARAAEYPWCAQYGSGDQGGRNCGFSSYEQCMATARGMGGSCERNLFYPSPASVPAPAPRKPEH